MVDSRSTPADGGDDPEEEPGDDAPPASGAGGDAPAESTADAGPTTDELRRRVEEKYDFESFGPEQMEEMTAEEWEAAFDPETWITGARLLDRVEADLRSRVADRDVFARVERLEDPARVAAYSDQGYAVVHADGSVDGRGTVLRDVMPTVALCSMEEYEVPDPPAGDPLPDPVEVPEGSGEFGNLMLQVVAAAQLLAGVGLLGAWLLADVGLVGLVAGLVFLLVGIVLLVMVANARLSDRFRAAEYRSRLRAVGVDSEETPDSLAAARAAHRDEREGGSAAGSVSRGDADGASGPDDDPTDAGPTAPPGDP